MDLIQIPSRYRHPKRRRQVACHIIHTTGATNFDEIVAYYRDNRRGIGPHYLIDYDGKVYQFVDEGDCAFHAGYTGDGPDNQRRLYERGRGVWTRRIDKAPWIVKDPYPGYDTWIRRWGDRMDSPLGLVCGPAPNDMSIGIEVQEPKHRQPEKFFDAQYNALAQLLKESAGRLGLPLDRDHLLGHYDVNPIVRAGKEGDRDPGEAFNWPRLLEMVR